MAATYLPLIGGNNVVSVVDASSTPMGVGTIDGVVVAGRAGSLRTSLLVSLDDASVSDVPATTAVLLFSVTVECPPGFSTPAAAGEVGFDYSQLLPAVSASCVCGAFTAPAGEWPSTLDTLTGFINLVGAFPANLVAISGRLSGVTSPTPTQPYGTLTFAFTGAATVDYVPDALIAVSIDFGASLVN